VLGVRRHGRPHAERPDEVFGERQYDDGHLGGTDVHDAHPRVYETGQRSPELVHVRESGLVEAELAARLVHHRAEFGVRQSAYGWGDPKKND